MNYLLGLGLGIGWHLANEKAKLEMRSSNPALRSAGRAKWLVLWFTALPFRLFWLALICGAIYFGGALFVFCLVGAVHGEFLWINLPVLFCYLLVTVYVWAVFASRKARATGTEIVKR